MRLGQLIVEQSGLAESNNTLARWLAHYIAELMERAELTENMEERDRLRGECANLILRLWAQRRDWPVPAPLSNILPVLAKAAPKERYVTWRERLPESWLDAISRLAELHSKEMSTCWDAAVLQVDRGQLSDSLDRAEAFEGEMDEEEAITYEILRLVQERLSRMKEVSALPTEEQASYFKERLAEIHAERSQLFTNVTSTSISLTTLLPREEDEPLESETATSSSRDETQV